MYIIKITDSIALIRIEYDFEFGFNKWKGKKKENKPIFLNNENR